MFEFDLTDKFKNQYAKLDKTIKKATNAKLKLLQENIHHPSLKTTKIKGTQDFFEARINKNFRIIFSISGNVITLLMVQNHDILDKKRYK